MPSLFTKRRVSQLPLLEVLMHSTFFNVSLGNARSVSTDHTIITYLAVCKHKRGKECEGFNFFYFKKQKVVELHRYNEGREGYTMVSLGLHTSLGRLFGQYQ